jgi:hypothetical protein
LGRANSSLRPPIDIEKPGWKQFRKYLCRQDGKNFNQLSPIPKIYCHPSSNLANSPATQTIFMSTLFHNEKIFQSKIITSKEKIETGQNGFGLELFEDKNYERITKNWKKFTDCLNKDDKSVFKKMIKDYYFKYSKSITSNKKGEFDPCLARSLLMALIPYQQKQINNIKEKQNEALETLPN